jgi:hypothetical protein
MIKEIYKVRIKSLVKDFIYFQSFAQETKAVIENYKNEILALTTQVGEIVDDEQFSPQEKIVLINERMSKIDDYGHKMEAIHKELSDKNNLLIKEQKVLINTFLDANPDVSRDVIISEIEKEMKKLL